MPRVLVNTCAKINWVLNITGARPDGYHDLDTLMQQDSTLYNNSFAQMVQQQGEQQATANLRNEMFEINARGEIIRNFAA